MVDWYQIADQHNIDCKVGDWNNERMGWWIHVQYCHCHRSERDTIATRGLASVVMLVDLPIGLLGWISIIMVLKIIEIFQGL